jgi:hypothetical protein
MQQLQENLSAWANVAEFGIWRDENIQRFNCDYIFIWVRKLDSDSLTETKN